MSPKPDSLIFDMDGTLWDAMDTYVLSWNKAFQKENIERSLSRAELGHVMGWEKARVLKYFFPNMGGEARERIFRRVNECCARILPETGGKLYEGVREGIINLSARYRLFIVSNCPEGLIQEFIKWADIQAYITDEMAHGLNSMPKHFNMQVLISKHGLNNPVYIGDTEIDSEESRLAGLPFVFLSHGFGDAADYDLKFDDFSSFTQYFLSL